MPFDFGDDAATVSSGEAMPGGDMFVLMTEDEIDALPPVRYIVQNWIAEDTTGIVWGKSGSTKSFVLLDIAMHVTRGLPWHGSAVQPGGVCMVVGESPHGVRKRLRAWKHHHKNPPAKAPFVMLPQAINLLDDTQVRMLIWQLQKMMRETGVQFRLVVLDTLAKCMRGEENSNSDMGAAVASMDRIRTELGCAVFAVHHAGKDADRGPRGGSALYAGVDTSICVTRERDTGDAVTLAIDKQKDDVDDIKLRFTPHKVTLPLEPGRGIEDSLVLIEQQIEVRKAAPDAGKPVDLAFADLQSIACHLDDNACLSLSEVAVLVFRRKSSDNNERVREAVPDDWVEVDLSDKGFGVRQLKREKVKGTKGDVVRCRYVRQGEDIQVG